VTPDFFGPVARDDLAQALAWIARDDEAAARAMLQATVRSARRIVGRPMLGRVRPELLPAPYRFWRVAGFPYLMVYNADRRPPVVLRVLHMARDFPPLLEGLSGPPDDDPGQS